MVRQLYIIDFFARYTPLPDMSGTTGVCLDQARLIDLYGDRRYEGTATEYRLCLAGRPGLVNTFGMYQKHLEFELSSELSVSEFITYYLACGSKEFDLKNISD